MASQTSDLTKQEDLALASVTLSVKHLHTLSSMETLSGTELSSFCDLCLESMMEALSPKQLHHFTSCLAKYVFLFFFSILAQKTPKEHNTVL